LIPNALRVGTAEAVFTVPEGEDGKVRVVLRAKCPQPDQLEKAFRDKGYNILEFS